MEEINQNPTLSTVLKRVASFSLRKLFLILAGVLVFGVAVFGSYWLGQRQEKERNRQLIVQELGSCKIDSDCVVAINPAAACACPSAYSYEQLKKNKNLIPYEEYEKRRDEFQRQNSSGVICKPCQPNPIAICNEESYCSLISASQVEASLSQDERKLVDLVKKDLVQKLNIDIARVTLLKIQETDFSDSSLGCPQEGYSYLEVITPGRQMLFEVEGKIYDYRMGKSANEGIICLQHSGKAVYSCAKDSDCPQGLVCVGKGPAKPSPEIPGVCLSPKQKQGVQ